jgi:hypothetical protein
LLCIATAYTTNLDTCELWPSFGVGLAQYLVTDRASCETFRPKVCLRCRSASKSVPSRFSCALLLPRQQWPKKKQWRTSHSPAARLLLKRRRTPVDFPQPPCTRRGHVPPLNVAHLLVYHVPIMPRPVLQPQASLRLVNGSSPQARPLRSILVRIHGSLNQRFRCNCRSFTFVFRSARNGSTACYVCSLFDTFPESNAVTVYHSCSTFRELEK